MTPTDADREAAALLLCESDHRWEKMNGDQRAVWLRSARTDPKMRLLAQAIAAVRAESTTEIADCIREACREAGLDPTRHLSPGVGVRRLVEEIARLKRTIEDRAFLIVDMDEFDAFDVPFGSLASAMAMGVDSNRDPPWLVKTVADAMKMGTEHETEFDPVFTERR